MGWGMRQARSPWRGRASRAAEEPFDGAARLPPPLRANGPGSRGTGEGHGRSQGEMEAFIESFLFAQGSPSVALQPADRPMLEHVQLSLAGLLACQCRNVPGLVGFPIPRRSSLYLVHVQGLAVSRSLIPCSPLPPENPALLDLP